MIRSILKLTLIFLLTLFPTAFYGTGYEHKKSGRNLTAREVEEVIKKQVNCSWQEKTVDTFKAGDPDTEVTGIVCTFMATMDVLYKAVATNCNLIITHEPIFYNHLDETSQFSNDDVVEAKKKYISDHGLVIWRFHDHIHMMKPDGIMEGMINKLDWAGYKTDEPLIFRIPETTVGELSDALNHKFSRATIRIVGDPAMKVSQVAYAAGAPGYMFHVMFLKKDNVDVLVAGEVPEWESISYVRDASSLGMKKAMILIGHVNSEESGMEFCSTWLKGFIKDIPVNFVPAGDAFVNR
ncbi:MAG TPA: Nif3-like dinuclear metal center hexameric protein [Cyclobacteriaceae bacterium]|nr:Nif3-like dinuclear metal center hexameric protein [Cyclobacteriaceae bacterium]